MDTDQWLQGIKAADWLIQRYGAERYLKAMELQRQGKSMEEIYASLQETTDQ